MKLLQSQLTEGQSLKFLDSLIRDLESENANEGQIKIALSSLEHWQKWGIHYFYALKIAHHL
jgi:hypothetical protein